MLGGWLTLYLHLAAGGLLLLLWAPGSAGQAQPNREISLIGKVTSTECTISPVSISNEEIIHVTVKDREIPKGCGTGTRTSTLKLVSDRQICVTNEIGYRGLNMSAIESITIDGGIEESFKHTHTEQFLREICSSKNEMNFKVKWHKQGTYIIRPNFQFYYTVMSIENIYRQGHLDSPMCDTEYKLNHSRVTVIDKLVDGWIHEKKIEPGRRVHVRCDSLEGTGYACDSFHAKPLVAIIGR